MNPKAITLKELLSSNWELLDDHDVRDAFCNDIKSTLVEDDILNMIDKIFQIESSINIFRSEVFKDNIDVLLPSLDNIFLNLSPLMLRSIWENLSADNNSQLEIIKGWQEALRVALEEEVYVWQEKNV